MSLKPILFTLLTTIGLTTQANEFTNPSQENQLLATQRENYQKINQLLAISKSQPTLDLAKQLLAEIQGYSLASYAEYRLLRASPELNADKIQQFLRQHPSLPVEANLKNQWINQLVEKQDWSTLLKQYTEYPKDNGDRCLYLQASYHNKPDLAQWKNQVQEIWLTGNKLTKQCDAVIALWQAQGIAPELLLQRAALATEKKNLDLLTTLQSQGNTPELQQQISTFIDLVKNPQNLPHFAENALVNDINKQVIVAIFPQYVKTLNDKNALDKSNPFALFDNWINKFNLNAEQIAEWKFTFISQIFDSEIDELQQWRDQQVTAIKDDRLLERRIRIAIWQQTDLSPWLNLLSQTALDKDEWKYWQAKILYKTDRDKAKAIWQAMSTGRGFYPMLASAELNIDYQPIWQQFQYSKQKEPINERFAIELARLQELHNLKETATVNLEWKALMDKSSFEEKLALSQYAVRQQWFDLAVDATIQAKSWDYVHLRLPNAYLPWFDLHLNNKKIHRTFAMAIARQESAWRPQVTSSANARGLMQLLPSTAKLTANKFNLPYNHENQLNEPFNNIMLGTAHLQELYDKYGNNRILIAAAYNAGTSRVDRWLTRANGKLTMAEFIASIPFYETRGYVQNVLAYDYYYQLLQGFTPRKFSKDEYDRLY